MATDDITARTVGVKELHKIQWREVLFSNKNINTIWYFGKYSYVVIFQIRIVQRSLAPTAILTAAHCSVCVGMSALNAVRPQFQSSKCMYTVCVHTPPRMGQR